MKKRKNKKQRKVNILKETKKELDLKENLEEKIKSKDDNINTDIANKKEPKEKNRERVKKYRAKLRTKGFKHISFYVSEDTYNQLQILKRNFLLNDSYADIISKLVSEEVERIKKEEEVLG